MILACITARASRTCRDACRDRQPGKTFPAFPAHAQPAMLRIWQEAHVLLCHVMFHSVLAAGGKTYIHLGMDKQFYPIIYNNG